MVTKSIMSSPPRIRGEPIDIQEIEVELSSTKYPSSKSTKSASASNSIIDPNPAAPTPSPPNVNKKQIRNPATPQKAGQTELNDREPLKEPQTKSQQKIAVAKSESPKVSKGKQFPFTLPTEENAMLAPEINEDATEPSVVEVQLSNSPKSHASAQKSSPPKIQSVKSSATSVAPTSKPRMLTKAQRATSLPATKTSNVAAGAVITAAANAIKSKAANKSPSMASINKAMATAKAGTTTATKSTNATAGSFAATKKSISAIVAKTLSPTVESGAKPAIPTVESAAKPPASAGTSEIKSVSPTVVSVSKSSSPTVASTIASTVASSATTSTPASSPIPVGTALTKSPSVPKMTSGQTRSIAAAPSLTKSPSSAAKLIPSKTISHAKPPAPIFVPITPPATKTESRFRLGRSKTGRVYGQVVRDGKLCHVRLTLAFLTGITAERLPEYQHLPLTNSKKYAASPNSKSSSGISTSTPPTDELVPIGFAMLSQGDGTMALSHPMKPFDFASNVPRQTLIWTDNSDSMSLVNTLNEDDHGLSGDHDDESQLTHSAGQRRLYFEVSLNREGDSSVPPEQNNDIPDDATATSMLKEVAANFSPELVAIVVGLKKGEDQVIPLGIATLVVSGREVSGQHADLPVRSLTLAERETYSLDSSDKKKRKGPAFRLFGGNKRAEAASLYSFKNEHHSYSLAPNATLRVRLDVRSGIYREHGPALWGDILIPRPDDESRGTVTVYDLSTQGDRETVKRSLIPLDDRHEYVEVLPNANGTTIISSPGGALGLSPVYSSQHSKLQGRDDESLQTRFEVTSIFAGSTDVRSVESTSEHMSLLERLENAGICGALDKLDDRALSSSNSFASTLPDIDPPELDSVQSALSVGDKFLAEIPSSTSKNSKSASRATQTSVSSAPLNAVEDDDDDEEVVAGVFCSGGASKSSGADSSTEEGTRTSATTRSVGTRSVGDETYQKVMEAKETLMRYASRVGVEMEDLLDEDDSTLRRRGSSSFSGSTNISR